MSYGQDLLREYLELIGKGKYIENFRPDWLNGLELDFYFPGKKLALEFNGDQHYAHTEFGSPYSQWSRDRLKRELCKKRGIRLAIIDACDLEYTRLIGRIGGNKKMVQMNRKKLRILNKKSKAYRKLLIEKYDSVTARKKGSKIRVESLNKMNNRYS